MMTLPWAELQQGGSHLQSVFHGGFFVCGVLVWGVFFLLPVMVVHTIETPENVSLMLVSFYCSLNGNIGGL